MYNEQELARCQAKRAPYEIISIICEDSKSSPGYFKEIIKYFRLNTANVDIVPSKGSAPITVVDHAIEIAKKKTYDLVFCVFDRDEHESFARAVNKLESQSNYKAIISTPSFEIWLLLHFGFTAKCYSNENLISDLKKKLPSYNKNQASWFKHLIDKLDIAIKNAKQLQKENHKTHSDNPATNVHELIEYLRTLNIRNT